MSRIVRLSCGLLGLLLLSGSLLWLQPTVTVERVADHFRTEASGSAGPIFSLFSKVESELHSTTSRPVRSPAAAAADAPPEAAARAHAKRYAYGTEAPMELPSPPPPQPAEPPPTIAPGGCATERRYERYLHQRKWTAAEMQVAKGLPSAKGTPPPVVSDEPGYMCYRHRDVADDAKLGRSTCKKPYTEKRCPVRQPTFPTAAGTCLCCPMAGHACPPCWGCLMPLSRRRAFGGKLYERETGGTADVYFAAEELRGERVEVCAAVRNTSNRPRHALSRALRSEPSAAAAPDGIANIGPCLVCMGGARPHLWRGGMLACLCK